MKNTHKLIILLFAFVLINTSTLACQYTIDVFNHSESKLVPYSDDEKLEEPYFEFSENCWDTLKIVNPNPVPINFTLDVDLFGQSVFGTETIRPRFEIYIEPESNFELSPQSPWWPIAKCKKFLNNYDVIWKSNDFVELKLEKIDYYDEVCKRCNGKICLDDGVACSLDSECGHGECNIAGVCGPFTKCASTQLNCNNETCATPSVKENGEAYSCEWECKSGIGQNGICKAVDIPPSLIKIVLRIILILILMLFVAYFVQKIVSKRKRDLEISKVLEEQAGLKALEESEYDKISKKYTKKIEGAEEELKRIEEKLDALKDSREEDAQKYVLVKKMKEAMKEELQELKRYREEREKELNTPYVNEEGVKVIRNENGYEVFPDSKKVFHTWWFEVHKGRRVKKHHEIHHKDFDKLNNDINNLEEMLIKDHKETHKERARNINNNSYYEQ